jgi:hypothetical protein
MKRGGGLGEESERQSRRLLLHPAAAETFASYNLHAIMMMMIIMPYTIRNPSLHPMLQLYNWIISIPVRELFRAIIPHPSLHIDNERPGDCHSTLSPTFADCHFHLV